MALDPNAFGPDSGNDSQQPGLRQQKMRALLGGKASLGSLFNEANDTSDLSKSSLNGGETSSPLATPGLGAEPATPSLLASERVERAPSFAGATPLLTGDQQAGAELGEASRGEVGVIGGGAGRQGLSTADRNRALMSFFRPQQSGQESSAQPSDAAKAISAGGRAASASGKARSLFGSVGSTDLTEALPKEFGSSGTFLGGPTAHEMAGVEPTGTPTSTNEFGPSNENFASTRDAASGPRGWTGPDFTKLGTYGAGLGTAGSLASLIGTATNNPNLAKAGGAAGVAGQGVNFADNPSVAGGAGLAGAGVGLLGSLMKNKEMSLAGQGLSLGSNLYSLGSSIGSAAGTAPTAGAAAAGAGASAGEAAGAGATAAGAGVGGEALGELGLSGLAGGAGIAFAPAALGYAGMNIARSIDDAARYKRDMASMRNVLGAKVPSAVSRLSKTLSGVSSLDPTTASTDELMAAQQQLQAARGEFNSVDHAFKGALTVMGKPVNTGLSMDQVKPQIDALNKVQLAIQDELERRGTPSGQIPGYQSPVAWANATNPDAFRATTGRLGYESDGETPILMSLAGADRDPAAYANYARDPGAYGIDPNDPTLDRYRKLSGAGPGNTRATLSSLFGQQ